MVTQLDNQLANRLHAHQAAGTALPGACPRQLGAHRLAGCANRGFFNGTSVCLRVEGQETSPHVLELPAPCAVAGWSVATGLTLQKINAQGFGRYQASDYDELVDCPVEMGAFWSGSFYRAGRAAPLCEDALRARQL